MRPECGKGQPDTIKFTHDELPHGLGDEPLGDDRGECKFSAASPVFPPPHVNPHANESTGNLLPADLNEAYAMKVPITEITLFNEAEYFAASEPPEIREAIQQIYAEVQYWILKGIKKTARRDDFFPHEICIDWEKGELRATAAVYLKFTFIRQQDQAGDKIEITSMTRDNN